MWLKFYCGAGKDSNEAARPALFDVNGFTVGMIAFADRDWYPSSSNQPGTHSWQGDESAEKISALSKKVDFLIVQLHQRYEFIDYPNYQEMAVAKRAVSAGADLVLGQHGQNIKGVVRNGKAVIAYGLGNFIHFWFDWLRGGYKTKFMRRAVFRFQIRRHEVLAWDLIPLLSDEHGWPVAATQEEARPILAHFNAISSVLADERETERLFRRQAGKYLIPFAMKCLLELLRRDGPGVVIDRLLDIRREDISILRSHLFRMFAGQNR